MTLDYFKISISIFIPLLIFVLGYLKEKRTQRKLKKNEKKHLLKFVLVLLTELRTNLQEYPNYLKEISESINENYSVPQLIRIDSHTGGIIKRLSKIDPNELYQASALFIDNANQVNFYQRLLSEIDYLNDFYSRLLVTIKNYQENSGTIRREFRSELNQFMNFNASLITKLRENNMHNSYFEFVEQLTGEYLSTQSEDYNFHYQSYLRQISLYVRENHRTDYFANEIIERVKRHKVILDDLKGNSLLYGKYYLDDSEELQLSLIEIDKIIEEVNKNGM